MQKITKERYLNLLKLIKINPRYADAYNERGYAKEQLKDYKGAIFDYTEAIKINPRMPMPSIIVDMQKGIRKI